MKHIVKSFLKYAFRKCLNIVFSNDVNVILNIALSGRCQLVWSSEHIGRKIALRLYERAESQFFLDYTRADDVCLDIGANVGYYTQLFACNVGAGGRVLAIEPIRRNIALIRLNAFMNKVEDIVLPVCAIVDERDSDDRILAETRDSAYSFVLGEENLFRAGSDAVKPGRRKIPVRSVSVDRLFADLSLRKIDIVKIDVEGYEYRVLKGMRDLLSREKSRPRLMMIELSSEYMNYYGFVVDDVFELLFSYGYKAQILKKDGSLYPAVRTNKDLNLNVFFVL